jgi:hypothetical protein
MNPDSVPGLIQRFDLRFPGEPMFGGLSPALQGSRFELNEGLAG